MVNGHWLLAFLFYYNCNYLYYSININRRIDKFCHWKISIKICLFVIECLYLRCHKLYLANIFWWKCISFTPLIEIWKISLCRVKQSHSSPCIGIQFEEQLLIPIRVWGVVYLHKVFQNLDKNKLIILTLSFYINSQWGCENPKLI